MRADVITFVVLRGELQWRVVELATARAAFEPWRRRVIIDDDGAYRAHVGDDAVALTLRPDGSICDIFDRVRAVSVPWIDDGFIRAARVVRCALP